MSWNHFETFWFWEFFNTKQLLAAYSQVAMRFSIICKWKGKDLIEDYENYTFCGHTRSFKLGILKKGVTSGSEWGCVKTAMELGKGVNIDRFQASSVWCIHCGFSCCVILGAFMLELTG